MRRRPGADRCAQKVEHYEISRTARPDDGRQIGCRRRDAPQQSLAEEEIADNLMTQIARELMSQSRTG
jgi:ferritin-like metal-binding protein YciE